MNGYALVNRLTVSVAIAVVVAALIPMIVAIVLTYHEASRRERAYVTALAREALARSEETADQLAAGAQLVYALPPGEECSEAGLTLLRRVDLQSTLLQAVGRLTAGNLVDCLSIGDRRAIDLGPPDHVTATGALNWANVRLFGDDRAYLAIGRGSFVGIVHKQLALAFVDDVPGMAVATFNWSHRRPLLQRGSIDPRWLSSTVAHEGFFHDGEHAIAVARSTRYDIGAIAAIPVANTLRFTSRAALVLLPLGAITGVLLGVFLLSAVRTRLSMPNMIRSALKAGEFHLVYQPVVALDTQKIVGAEALIRWRRTDGVTILPDHFIGVAEQAGVIRHVTRAVLDMLADDVGDLLAVEPSFHFAVNLSAADIQSAELVDEIRAFAAAAGLPLGQLVVEATERSFVDAERAQATIRTLRDDGVRFAIDDFGTGYSSLGYLARLQVDYLKIDKLFVDAVGTDAATSQVAGRIIEMAQDLKLQLVAEGVETAAQADWVGQRGVELAQGYHFARPMAVDELVARLRAERRPAGAPAEAAA